MQQYAEKVRSCAPVRELRAPRRVLRGFGAENDVHDVLGSTRKVRQAAAVRALRSDRAGFDVFECRRQHEKTP